MGREDRIEKEFSECLDRMFGGEEVIIGADASDDLRTAFDFARRIRGLSREPSASFAGGLKQELLRKLAGQETQSARERSGGFWDFMGNLLPRSMAWRAVSTAAVVIILTLMGVYWYTGGFIQAPVPAPSLGPGPVPVPAPAGVPPPVTVPPPTITVTSAQQAPAIVPAPTPRPTPIPAPAPPPPFEVSVVPGEAYYLPGEPIEVSLSITNISSEVVTISPFPVGIQVTPQSDYDQVLFAVAAGTQLLEIKPGEAISVGFTWDQKDMIGSQVSPGWYNVIFKDITLAQGDTRYGINPGARVLVRYPQGAMEKTFELDQSRTVNGVTVTLESIELTATGVTVYAFNTPPGHTPPQFTLPTSPYLIAFAEYSVDSGDVKQAGSAGMRFLDNGTGYIWKNLDPVPVDATELTFKISMGYEEKREELLGPWEFKVPLG